MSDKLHTIYKDSNKIRAHEVPDEAGHVLVHYLHTGTYQTLHKPRSLQDSKTATQFGNSVHVYTAAGAYSLPGLADLAKEKISRWAEVLSARDMVGLAANACELLPDVDLWFLAFIKRRLRSFFDNSTSWDHSTFLECFHHRTAYSKVLANAMVHICYENAAAIHSTRPRALSSSQSSAGTVETPLTDSPQPSRDLALEPGPTSAPEAEAEPASEDMLAFEPEPETVPEVELESAPAQAALETGVEPFPETFEDPVAEAAAEAAAEPVLEKEAVDDLWSSIRKPKKGKKWKGKASQVVLECKDKVEHLGDGGWEECSSCRQYLGSLVSRFQSQPRESVWEGM